jgi:hypothetical protein
LKTLSKLARNKENWLSSDPVLYCAIGRPIPELSKLVAVATGGMAMAEAEAPRPFSEGLLPDLVQKRWVAGRENKAG